MTTPHVTSSEPSAKVLAKTIDDAFAFLRAASTVPAIRGLLATVGYSAEDHGMGWALFFEVAGVSPNVPLANHAANALTELETWQGPGFIRARAALAHMFPPQEKYVFAEIAMGAAGGNAIAFVATFLDRLDALESSADRKSTRKADHAALEVLAKRGIDKAVRSHLRQLVDITSTDAIPAAPPAELTRKRHEALVALYRWLKDWSDTARTVIARRDHLIRLGLARRRSPRKKATIVKTTPAPHVATESDAPMPPSRAAGTNGSSSTI
jgi:hypothetical protein